ncbi:MAG: dihydropteroate synthase [Candidatus Nanopelagicaceae bacterium]|nr:dihydropteroate synthase [Candidatus Nanopelagicaceae bacterium]
MTTLVMGILNVTPDSFADGGRHFSLEKALERADEMIAEGVDIIDVGGESTKPGAERVSEQEELDRVIPVITELVKKEVQISIDTTRSNVASQAIKLGVHYVNDVSGGLADPKMYKVIADNPQVQYIIMHWRAHSKNMQELATYKDVVKEVKEELEARIDSAIESGVNPEQIIIDPGLGFSKLPEHNWELLKNIDRVALLGYPVLVGASRKRFLGELTGATNPDERESASIAVTAMMAKQNIWAVRTHSVKPHRDAIATVNAFAKNRAG